MRKVITIVLLVLSGVFVYFAYNAMFITIVESDAIVIRRPDNPISYTTYNFSSEPTRPICEFEAVDEDKLFETSVHIMKDSLSGVFSIQYMGWSIRSSDLFITREPDGSVTVRKDGVRYDNQPYDEYKTHFEKAEKKIQEVRERFEPIIKERLKK